MERFLKLKNPIQKAIIDLNLQINFSDSEFDLISRTVSALLPIKLAVEALCRRDSKLLTANATINFMLQSLKEQHTSLSEELYITLKNHTEESNFIGFLGKLILANTKIEVHCCSCCNFRFFLGIVLETKGY
ncbi:hypothetical protein CDAR_300351 [Caerostris darwini]|uniref:Uncharacterized protein n=1 Tax=Caerostris darwini TaxID=1538125 RepID=A0AAV4NTA2_9ARAC|nr:hypothetical protein CDAR_300351 [Caerostris darwini]